MKYYAIDPGPLLAPYIRYFWVLEGSFGESDLPGDSYTHRTMACGCPELCFHYKGLFTELLSDNSEIDSFRTGIHGGTTHFKRFRTREDFGLFGAFIYPFAVPLLLGIPACEINDQMPDLSSLLGREGENLSEQMLEAADNKQRTRILSAYLESKLGRTEASRISSSFRIIPAIREVVNTAGRLPIQQLSDQFFLSRRQFERAFRQYAGFSPKTFSRLLRFESALHEYGNRTKSLTDIAYDCGYYDQSHFIHEFKEFSGHHPRHYFSGEAEGTSWKD